MDRLILESVLRPYAGGDKHLLNNYIIVDTSSTDIVKKLGSLGDNDLKEQQKDSKLYSRQWLSRFNIKVEYKIGFIEQFKIMAELYDLRTKLFAGLLSFEISL